MEKRIIPVTLGNDKLRPIISEIIESNNVFDNLEFQLIDKNDLNKKNNEKACVFRLIIACCVASARDILGALGVIFVCGLGALHKGLV